MNNDTTQAQTPPKTDGKPEYFKSKKKRQEKMETLERATMIGQQLTRQLLTSIQGMEEDMKMFNLILNDFRYKLDEILKQTNIDIALFTANIDAAKIKDFEAQAAKEDVQENLIPAEEVGEKSTITITSVTANGSGTLRSRISLTDPRAKELTALIKGQKVGYKFDYTINGEVHNIEILDIKNPDEKEATKA